MPQILRTIERLCPHGRGLAASVRSATHATRNAEYCRGIRTKPGCKLPVTQNTYMDIYSMSHLRPGRRRRAAPPPAGRPTRAVPHHTAGGTPLPAACAAAAAPPWPRRQRRCLDSLAPTIQPGPAAAAARAARGPASASPDTAAGPARTRDAACGRRRQGFACLKSHLCCSIVCKISASACTSAASAIVALRRNAGRCGACCSRRLRAAPAHLPLCNPYPLCSLARGAGCYSVSVGRLG